MRAVAFTHSVSMPVVHLLVRCNNKSCNGFGWLILSADKAEPVRAFIWKHPSISQKPAVRLDKLYFSSSAAIDTEPNLPDLIDHDFTQALNCCESGFFDAAACMARRALERALISRGAQSSDKLSNMIAELSKRNILPEETKRLCDEIKGFGNRAAHPSDPTDEEDARNAVYFADIVISWLYGYITPIEGTLSRH